VEAAVVQGNWQVLHCFPGVEDDGMLTTESKR
jgi:hypothetical protein